MNASRSRLPRWFVALLAVGIGVSADRLVSHATADAGLTTLQSLAIKEEIRQNVATYALLADGDGVDKKNLHTLVYTLMTPDVVSEIYPAGGGAPARLEGRERHAGPSVNPPASAEKPDLIAGRSYLVDIAFDEVTSTEVKTRVNALHLDVTKNVGGPECKKTGEDPCGGRVVAAVLWTYHMVWVKTREGWQLKYNGIHRDM